MSSYHISKFMGKENEYTRKRLIYSILKEYNLVSDPDNWDARLNGSSNRRQFWRDFHAMQMDLFAKMIAVPGLLRKTGETYRNVAAGSALFRRICSEYNQYLDGVLFQRVKDSKFTKDDSSIVIKKKPDFRVQPAAPPPPAPPKKQPRYVDSEEYFWRNLKRKAQRAIKDDSFMNQKRKPFKPVDFNREAAMMIREGLPREQTYKFQHNAMMVNEPNDSDKFTTVLRETHDRYSTTEEVRRDDEPVVNYYLNSLKSHSDIETYIRHIYDVEIKPFKIRMSFGNIVEDAHIDEHGEEYAYEVHQPHDTDAERKIPIVVKDNDHL